MTVQSTTANIFNNTINSTQKQSQATKTSFDSLISDNINNPKDIPFSDYKSFSISDIGNLFPIEKDKSLHNEAMELRDIANGTTDDNLNKILFSKKLNNNTTQAEKIFNDDIDKRVNGIKLAQVLTDELNATNKYMIDNNIAFGSIEKFAELQANLSHNIHIDEAKTIYKVTPEELFNSYELTLKDMKVNQEHHKNNSWLIHFDELSNIISSIKEEYYSSINSLLA
jgi:hypothetical protein